MGEAMRDDKRLKNLVNKIIDEIILEIGIGISPAITIQRNARGNIRIDMKVRLALLAD